VALSALLFLYRELSGLCSDTNRTNTIQEILMIPAHHLGSYRYPMNHRQRAVNFGKRRKKAILSQARQLW
jgi:hypothetical protein